MAAIVPANINQAVFPGDAHPAAADYPQIGDIKVMGANGVWSRLPVGNDGQVLTANSPSPLGLHWV